MNKKEEKELRKSTAILGLLLLGLSITFFIFGSIIDVVLGERINTLEELIK